MSKAESSILKGRMELRLRTEPFFGLTEELVKWRLDPQIRLMDAKKDKGRILGFVKGLRLSARILYILRTIISSKDLEVSWGHLVDESGESCSPECDIIIHKPGHILEWNGSSNPIMNFKFIEAKNAIAVVSCKSYAKSVDKNYCEGFLKYNLKSIFLMVECCHINAVENLKNNALESGYKGFYYLYAMNDDTGEILRDEKNYIDFIEAIQSL